VTVNYGIFVNTIISFLIIGFTVFLVVRYVNKLRREKEALPAVPTTKECPFCLSTVPVKATRCAYCTSELK